MSEEKIQHKDSTIILIALSITVILIISFLSIKLYYSKPRISITYLDIYPPREKQIPYAINENSKFNVYYNLKFNTLLDDVELFFDYPNGCLVLEQKNPLLYDLRDKELNKELILFSRFSVPEKVGYECLNRNLRISLIITGKNNLRDEREMIMQINQNVSLSTYCRECIATCNEI